MTGYNWKGDKTKLLRMLRNSKTLKEKNGWTRRAGAGFVKDDLDSVELGPDKTITVKAEAFTMTGKTGDFNLRETEEMISFLEMKIHLAEHKKSLLDEWDLIKKYEKVTPESEQSKKDYERWKKEEKQ